MRLETNAASCSLDHVQTGVAGSVAVRTLSSIRAWASAKANTASSVSGRGGPVTLSGLVARSATIVPQKWCTSPMW